MADSKHKRIWVRAAGLAIAGFAAAIAAGDRTGAASSRRERPVESIDWRAAGEPIMAIVSLRSQRITIYDARGLMAQAPVSSGQKGRETPAGIFSVLQKDADHYSNLYDDAYMPHMQRLTWSGIALHGGPLPGYPASHGCVRMPYDFARNLFDATRLGMRVIVVPADVAPVEIAHPALFQPMKSDIDSVAAARNAEAQDAAGKADQARLAALTASQEAARATIAVRVAENLKLRAQAQLAAVDRAIRSAASSEPGAHSEEAKTPAAARLAELEAQLAVARAELAPKLDALTAARTAAWRRKTRGASRQRRRRRWREILSQFRSSSAARRSAFTSGKRFGPFWKARLRLRIPIVRSARMSLPPWSAAAATGRCDGPWSRCAAARQPSAPDTRAGAAVRNLSR